MVYTRNFDLSEIEPEHSAPAPERVISGNPRFTTWSVDEAQGGIYCGVWKATPGKWRVEYDEWEYFYMHEGRSILTVDGKEPIELVAGSRLVISPGMKGTWEVIETTVKDYVIRL